MNGEIKRRSDVVGIFPNEAAVSRLIGATEGVPFSVSVTDPGYKEFWSDELQLFHNPNAKISIPVDMFGGITQHFFENGNHQVITPEGAVLVSRTVIISPKEDDTTQVLPSP